MQVRLHTAYVYQRVPIHVYYSSTGLVRLTIPCFIYSVLECVHVYYPSTRPYSTGHAWHLGIGFARYWRWCRQVKHIVCSLGSLCFFLRWFVRCFCLTFISSERLPQLLLEKVWVPQQVDQTETWICNCLYLTPSTNQSAQRKVLHESFFLSPDSTARFCRG